MKNFIFILILFALCGCKSAMLNWALEKKGIYDDYAIVEQYSSKNKTIVLLPLHHLGTQSYYTDLSNKTDSLLRLDFSFYKEMVLAKNKKDTALYIKSSKMIEIANNKLGYDGVLNDDFVEKFNIKLKKELINQPSYESMGLDSTNSIFTDPSLEDIIGYYEANAEIIPITDCDLEYGPYEFFDNCEKYEPNKKVKEAAMRSFREHQIMSRLLNDSHSKIAILYGANHTKAIGDSLVKLGFKVVE